MKQHLLCLTMVVGLFAGAGAGGAGCARRGPAGPEVERPQPLPANSFAREWRNDLELRGDQLIELHLREGVLFAYTRRDDVFAVGRTGGELRYFVQPEVSGGVLRPPLILGQYVIYPSGSTLEIYNQRGRHQRTMELEKSTRSGAIGAGNTVYIGLDHTGGTGTVASVDITRPYKFINWELMTFGPVSPTPALFDGTIFAGSEDGRLYAVTEERGAVWALENGSSWFSTQGRFLSDVKADEFGVYASNTDSKVYCLDRMTGRIKWQYFSGTPLRESPVVTQDLVYQYVPGQGIVALDKTTGTFNRAPRWIVKNGRQVLSQDEQNVYLRARDNRLLAVNKQSGQVLFQSRTRDFEIFTTNLHDATIFAATPTGTIWAIRPILREGEVGTLVMDLRAEPVAMR